MLEFIDIDDIIDVLDDFRDIINESDTYDSVLPVISIEDIKDEVYSDVSIVSPAATLGKIKMEIKNDCNDTSDSDNN